MRKSSALPGFGLSMGITLLWLSLVVIIPLIGIFLKSSSISSSELQEILHSERIIASLKLSFGAAFVAALVNVFFGFLLSWTLVRYTFPGKKIVDAMIDLPFALPTAVAGIALTTLFSPNGFLGGALADIGIQVDYTRLGIVVALTFIGIPFVVRTVQPVLSDLELELEEAASALGANRWQIFLKIIVPVILPAILTGFALAFARGIGEYGSVIFIAGNQPYETEITPLLIVSKLEEYDYAGATTIAVIMLITSFILLLIINLLQLWVQKSTGKEV